MTSFVLNDENQVNSYGFRVPNKGINLTRFKANPVMLDDHNNSTSGVIGKWDNIRVSGSMLLADPDFDLHTDLAKDIAGKVNRGYLKGASMGISFDRAAMQKAADGIYELSACEKYESSICAIPSNSNAVKLYVASTGQLMTDAMVKLNIEGLNLYGGVYNPPPAFTSNEVLFANVNSRDDFENLSPNQKQEFAIQFPVFFLNIMKTGDRVSTPLNQTVLNVNSISTPDDFEKLTFSQKLAFQSLHPQAYLDLWKR